MSKFLALVCAGVASAATVSVHEHFATNDPHVMLESMRAFAKQAQQGKIPTSTFDTVKGFVDAIETQLMESMEECVQIEDRFVTSVRQTLTELNNKLGNDVTDVAGEEAAIDAAIEDVIIPGRLTESRGDNQRTEACDDVCSGLRAEPPCTPPTNFNLWKNDLEPCCDTQTNQADVPAPLRSSQWKELEDYMECLDTFIIGDGLTTSAYEAYTGEQDACINASEVWQAKKEQIDPSDGSVASDLCTMIQNDDDKCSYYFTNWELQMGNLTNVADHSTNPGRLAIAKDLVDNTYQQYEALRKIKCLFEAIRSGQDGSVDVAAACEACENEEPVCTEMCNADPLCPDELKCSTCCLPHIEEQPCENRHKCDVCTDKFRHEFYDCPAADWNNTVNLCHEVGGAIEVISSGQEPSPQCKLLIRQLGCTDFDCEAICNTLDEGAGSGYIAQTQGKPTRRAYEPFTCGGEDLGNWNFAL